MRRFVALVVVLVVAALGAPSPAAADEQTLTFRYGPIELLPYEVKQDDTSFGVPKPQVDGFVTGMEARAVDSAGREMPRQRLMLHHAVFSNLGRRVGDRRDASCDRYTLLDSETQLPGVAERFYGVGEERLAMRLPPGYGYPVKGDDQWLMTWMLMNHRGVKDTAFIEYTVRYDTARSLAPVKPVWLDVANCSVDPVFDVAGGGRRGSSQSRSATWTAPWSGRIVAGAGHLHGGGKAVVLDRPGCPGGELFRSLPTWGTRRHPVYRLRPVLHEPGPLRMGAFVSPAGMPVTSGQELRITASYDNELPHTRAMGILLVYIAPDEGVRDGCAPPPSDVQALDVPPPGRSTPPRIEVPLTEMTSSGGTRDITRPPGRTLRRRSGATVSALDLFFRPVNLVVPAGATLRWSFPSETLHNVTLANGPRGFSSPNLSRGRVFEHRFTARGTYRLFCTLHPIQMTGTVTVGGRRGARRR